MRPLLAGTLVLALAVMATTAAGPALAQGFGEDDASSPAPSVDLTKRPFIIFAPVPPKPEAIAHYPLPDGADDYWDLWEPDAPWQDAAARIDLFAMHSWMIRHSSSDDDLQRMIAWLAEHDIPLGLEMEPLEWPGPEVCDHTESFEGPWDMEMARRIKALGGTVAVVQLDEPFVHAHKLSGPGACGYSVEQIVDEVAAYRDELRRLFPEVVMGSIEAVVSDPYTTAEDMAIWLDTFHERSGEPFAFLNIDVDWRREGWQETVLEIEAVADARGVPFGMLYLGSEFEQDSEAWLLQSAQHMASFEQEYGGTPDIVGIYSWHPRPDRLLPDDDPAAFTSLINRYLGVRTSLETPRIDAGGTNVIGRLTSADGDPLPGRQLRIRALPLNGTPQRHSLTGTVPSGAGRAIIGVRANVEGGTPSGTDVRILRVGYEESGDGVNRVANPRFRKGANGWAGYGDGSVKVKRGALRLKGSPEQAIFVDGSTFPVTPGSEFEFTAVLDVPATSFGSGYISVMFIDEEEIERQSIWFGAKPIELPVVITDDDGAYRVKGGGLDPGRYDIEIDYEGDVEHWAARTSATLRLK